MPLWEKKQALYDFSVKISTRMQSKAEHGLYIENTSRKLCQIWTLRHVNYSPVWHPHVSCAYVELFAFRSILPSLPSLAFRPFYLSCIMRCGRPAWKKERWCLERETWRSAWCFYVFSTMGFASRQCLSAAGGPMQLLRAFQTHETYFITAFVKHRPLVRI